MNSTAVNRLVFTNLELAYTLSYGIPDRAIAHILAPGDVSRLGRASS